VNSPFLLPPISLYLSLHPKNTSRTFLDRKDDEIFLLHKTRQKHDKAREKRKKITHKKYEKLISMKLTTRIFRESREKKRKRDQNMMIFYNFLLDDEIKETNL
jgi:phosphoenolpyruvate carboxylase